jgi:hypothetical protein
VGGCQGAGGDKRRGRDLGLGLGLGHWESGRSGGGQTRAVLAGAVSPVTGPDKKQRTQYETNRRTNLQDHPTDRASPETNLDFRRLHNRKSDELYMHHIYMFRSTGKKISGVQVYNRMKHEKLIV